MIPFITCGIALCQSVCELVFGVNVTDLDFGVQIDSIKKPIKSNSVGSGYVSHCRASSRYDHLNHGFIVLKDIPHGIGTTKLSRLMERDQQWSDRDWCAWLESVSAYSVVFLPTSSPVTPYDLWFCWFGLLRNETHQSLNPKDREREFHPCVNLHREK